MNPNNDKNNSLLNLGLKCSKNIYWNLPTSRLYEESILRNEGILSNYGALVLDTRPCTGRLPKDKFIVRESSSEDKIWWGEVNKSIEGEKFEALKIKVLSYLQERDVFIQDCFIGTDEKYRIPVRVISEKASGALFAKTMIPFYENKNILDDYLSEYTIIHAPDFNADPKTDGTHSNAFIIINFGKKIVLIGGTKYSGEIKKSAFTIMNYVLPQKGIMAMHASANYGSNENDAAVFFGLSGTGKTTLSTDHDRTLIGDDEHGWSDSGIFNFESGCYAKVIRLSEEQEPDIFKATRKFGTILENVVINPETREVNLDDDSYTENTRASYPITHIENMARNGKGGHPKNIIMLTCDAFGILPPVARLNLEQAMYYFICGYTAKVAGTEAGIKEPQAAFSPCFGAPFMALPPVTYANLLGEKIKKHSADVWLINTGWSGGPYGTGSRIKLPVTRAIVRGILNGDLKNTPTEKDPIFNFEIPKSCPNVSSEILFPKNTWSDKARYEAKAKELAKLFEENFISASDGKDLKYLARAN